MTGKKQVERKVTRKKQHELSPRKLDLKKEKEQVKLLGGLVAEMTAVQAELTKRMDDSLLKLEGNTNPNPEGLQIEAYQLKQVNILGALLNAKVQDYLDGLLDVFDRPSW
ncbi:uncharacterized protein LOC111276640 [Durio zibethinus]|uniref:Uncharacterized protein LOC111276640 n=1 Tax=Durio zibethinus TaxID=66656 RepID=A0A6P5WRH5_DURZI|nr:uncharacterized protein LOC111276640 [Durio zibethinus]